MADTSETTFRNERSDSTSSATSASLTAQKRSSDPASLARRQSLHEQRPRVGFIGQMWNNWVRGTTK
ncbi:hypothetical protein B0T25DRAFT_573861 [Lasiosphaeria hispida]|uniref:Conidiation-specific protein 8 n=1 Tax=Lasiosphaeria hispida TaxID=260671 RepID=A0AAJ0M8B3_9PEZI|nr:hypothetical protein B0T25DRAFT_573861 [Lasiosphaeria hispida]